ncbi:MAG TPA: endonuclease domain-containing protein [Rugosimonospora sp.]|nr:endonuclease domain-containing protein [Rugosimonospora sp.]
MTGQSTNDHEKCHHKKYRLTCAEIDGLRELAGGRCQICGKLERYTSGLLRIDHDKKLGFWAVRGLLCTHCNMGLERGWLQGPEVDAYLANPWHKGLVGVGDIEPEPDVHYPIVSVDVALAEVTSAAQSYWQAYQHESTERKRVTRNALIDACHVAKVSGATYRVIASATEGLWTSGNIGVVLAERRSQPKARPSSHPPVAA